MCFSEIRTKPTNSYIVWAENVELLGALAKFAKVFVHVCLSAWNNSAPTGRIFMKFDFLVFFENLSGKLFLKSCENNGHFT